MSVLVHDCTKCGHRQDRHDPSGSVAPDCDCCTAHPDTVDVEPEPRLWPTFDARTGKPEPLHQPGTTRNAGRQPADKVCDCRRCHELAAEHEEPAGQHSA